jgi:prepilin-type N-terminal cleavage/methylation domain-containing protein
MLTMMKNNRGFTLPEVLVAMVVGMIILTAIYAAVISGQRSSGAIQRKVTTFQDARAALELMAAEIQMASYNPNLTTGIWRAANACNSTSGSQTNRGIQAADPNFITIEMDIDGTGALMDHADEIITYTYLGGANLSITRETNCLGAQPFLGGALADGSITTRVVSGAEILPASLSTHIADIARIEIALVVETQDIDPDMHQRRRMIYSNSVIVRNHVISQ